MITIGPSWFAHNDVEGLSFWADGKGTQIRQKAWLCYQDGDEESSMAVRLGWFAPDGQELMEQELITALRALPSGETTLELQSLFRPAAGLAQVKLGKTNFGFLAVRVAKSISEHFGGGILTNSEGHSPRRRISSENPRSGWTIAVPSPQAAKPKASPISITRLTRDPAAKWHVRQDGWMGASVCMDEGLTITPENPLRLRYLLHAHSGGLNSARPRSSSPRSPTGPLWKSPNPPENTFSGKSADSLRECPLLDHHALRIRPSLSTARTGFRRHRHRLPRR